MIAYICQIAIFAVCLVRFSSGNPALQGKITCDGSMPRPNGGGPRLDIIDETIFCCWSSPHEYFIGNYSKKELCCPGAVQPIYDEVKQLCNGTEVISKTDNWEQCGVNLTFNRLTSRCYKSPTRSLTWTVVDIEDSPIHPSIIPTTTATTTRTRTTTTERATDVKYCDPGTEGCCAGIRLSASQLCNDRGVAVEKLHTEDNDICDDHQTFNNEKKQCCDDRVIPKGDKCGSDSDPVKDIDCNGKIHRNVPETMRCCGTEIYNPMRQACCNSNIHKMRSNHRCDGNSYLYVSKHDPVLFYYFKPQRNTGTRRSRKCKYTGTLLSTNSESKDIVIYYHSRRPCKHLKNKWHAIFTKKTWQKIGKRLSLKSRSYLTRIPKQVGKEIKKYQSLSPDLLH